MIDYSVGIVSVVCKNIYSVMKEMLTNCRRTTGTSALTVFALTDYAHAAVESFVDKFRYLVSLGEVQIICILRASISRSSSSL